MTAQAIGIGAVSVALLRERNASIASPPADLTGRRVALELAVGLIAVINASIADIIWRLPVRSLSG